MDTEPTHNPDEQDDEQEGTRTNASVLDEIRAMRDEKVSEKPRLYAVPVPAYIDADGKPRLSVIYQYPEAGHAVIMAAVRRERQGLARGDAEQRLEGAGDLLVAACAAVVGRRTDGTLVDPMTNAPLEADELPPSPLRFNTRLADAFGIEVPEDVKNKPRFVLRNLFSPRGHATGSYEGDVALIATSDAVFSFINGVNVDVDAETLGE